MKNLVLVLVGLASGIVFSQDDPILSDSELYDVVHVDDTLKYTRSKSGDNDFYWSYGLLEHIFSDPLIRYIYGATNPKINNLLVNRDFGIVKKDPIPFTEWIETELNLSDYSDDRYIIKYIPVNMQYGQNSETLYIYDTIENKCIRTISVVYSPMEYDENGDWVEVTELKNIVSFSDNFSL
jgi:hypothetical protein